MSAIAGYWSAPEPGKAESLCRRLLEAQRGYGPDDLSLGVSLGYAAGRCLRKTLAEDRHDRQPVTAGEDRFLLVADLRLDNREELLADLGRPPGSASGLADSEILLRAWQRWEEGVLDRILGDYAFAVWDKHRHRLVLARDPLGERPLHYRIGDDFMAFASMPQPLAGWQGAPAEADEARMAAFVADLPPHGDRSFFAGVNRLQPGHMLVAGSGGFEVRRFWRPAFSDIRAGHPGDHAEGLREQIDRAVRRRLRRSRGAVGAHLSAGYDSSAVAASAALQLAQDGERLIAFTSAPRSGFDGPIPPGKVADESDIAAATAAVHSNVDHVVVRPPFPSPLERLAESNPVAGQPTGHVLNGAWWAAINEAAAARDVSVMLTAEVGNFTLSAGLGLDELADLIRGIRIGRWLAEARALARGDYRWRNVLNASLRPWIPASLYRRLRRFAENPDGAPLLVASRWRRELARQERKTGWDSLIALSGKQRRWAMLGLVDPGNFRKYSLARWGIEERDAAADRRLAEYCFSLPLEARLKSGILRPALREGLRGRVAPAIIEPPARGYQSADWYERLTGEDAGRFADAVDCEAVRRVVDIAEVRRLTAAWPTAGFAERSTTSLYAMNLPRALSAAGFIAQAAGAAVDEGPFAYRVFGLRIRSALRLPELGEPLPAEESDVEIVRGDVPAEGSAPSGLSVAGDVALLSIPEVGRYAMVGGRSVTVEPVPGASDRNVRLFLLGSAFAAILHQRGLLPLHANAVVVDGRAIAFLGHPGAGKSTLAAWFHDEGFRILADDVCVVTWSAGGRPLAHPGIPRLRLRPEAIEASGRVVDDYEPAFDDRDKFNIPTAASAAGDPVPLDHLYLLTRGGDGRESVAPLTGAAAVEALVANTYRGGYVPLMGRKSPHLLDCARLARSTPVFEASRPWDLDRLDESSRALLAHARRRLAERGGP